MKTYSTASSDLERCIAGMLAKYHDDLQNVTVDALFVFDDESSDQVLQHQGYPAQAVCRITPVSDRALGIADAVIVVDRATWQLLSARQREALIDHELTHLERVLDDETGKPKCDAVGRPKLAMRRHDQQIGIFVEVMQRHREASAEARAARVILD
ncbi:MAG: putative metallopeptidase, partial [Steroidobacteraceae bacterium]